MTRRMDIASMLSSANTFGSRSNDPTAQTAPLHPDGNASPFPGSSGGAVGIDSRGTESCRAVAAGALILLETAEPDFAKGHHKAASQDSQTTEILQEGFRHPSEEHRHNTTAFDSGGKEDSQSHAHHCARELKRRRSSYDGADMSSKSETSQASQMPPKVDSDVLIPSHDAGKQTTRKKKRGRPDGLSPSSTRIPAIYSRNPTHITQPEDLDTDLSTLRGSTRIAASNQIGERPLRVDETAQRLGYLNGLSLGLVRYGGLKEIYKEGKQWQGFLPSSVPRFGGQSYGQLLQNLTPRERQEYLRFVIKIRSSKLVTAKGVPTHLASALWERAQLEEPISVEDFEYNLRVIGCHLVLTAIDELYDLEMELSTRKNGT